MMFYIAIVCLVLIFVLRRQQREEVPTPAQIGRSTWTFLHTMAAYLPESLNDTQKRHIINVMNGLSALYPCNICGDHMKEYLQTNPVDVSSGPSFSRWLCNFHNDVNRRLNKKPFNCNNLQARWLR